MTESARTFAAVMDVEPTPVPGKDWSIAITKLELRTGTWSDKKLAAIDLIISNNKGADQSFLPTGQVTGFMGSSSKLYTDNSPQSLEESYRSLQEYFVQKERPMYQPGILKLSREVLVDAEEKKITRVIYRDDNGKNYEIILM